MQLEMTHATHKGQRRYQEDRYMTLRRLVPGEAILAVFDGHGGDECAEYCAANLPSIVEEVGDGPLKKVFEILHERTREFHSGCAASIVRIDEDAARIEVGILGDAPVILRPRGGERFWVAPEHNIRSNMEEAEKAVERGGVICNGYLYDPVTDAGLQMSRALGDASLDKVLLREPEIFSFPIGPGGYVLVASDGILDPAHTSDLMLDIQDTDTAESLVEEAVRVPTGDNVTAVLVRFK